MTEDRLDLLNRIKALAGGLLARPGPARIMDGIGKKAGWAVLVLGLAVFLLAQGYVTMYPFLNKEVPPEADDAFAYITKAVQMKECFFQDCPALIDLLAQASDRESDADPFLKFQVFSKTILIYHTLHSAVLVGLNGLGMSWEMAYLAVWAAGFILITAGAALLLSVLFGPGGAGIALMILPFFRNDGFDFMIPTNMVTALALALWAAVLTRVRGLPYLIVLGTLVLLPLHMIGILHVMVLLALYWLTASRPLEKGQLAATLISLGLVAIHLALPLVMSKPEFNVGPFTDSWFGPLALFPENFKTVVTTLTRFIENHGGYVICGLLLGIGAVFNDRVRRHRVTLVLGLCLGLVVASFLPRAPVPSNAFHRILTPFLVLLCGLMGRAGWVWLKESAGWLRQALTGTGPDRPEEDSIPGPNRWRQVGLVLLGLVLIRVVVFGAMDFRASAKPVVDYLISRKDFRFDPAQVELLTSQARPGDVVFYRNIVPMQYYLNHGALKYGAVMALLLSGDKEERENWLETHPPGFVVTGSPFWGLSDGRPYSDRPIYQRGGAFIPPGTGLSISLAGPRPLAGLEFMVEWPEAPGKVRLKVRNGTSYSLTGSAKEPGRLVLVESKGDSAKSFTISGTKPFRLIGFRLEEDQPTRWPWDKGVDFKTQPRGSGVAVRNIRLETSAMNPLSDKKLEVLDDKGSSVLFRVVD